MKDKLKSSIKAKSLNYVNKKNSFMGFDSYLELEFGQFLNRLLLMKVVFAHRLQNRAHITT